MDVSGGNGSRDGGRDKGQSFPPGREIDVHEEDTLRLTGAQMDAYMDWYGATFLAPEDDRGSGSGGRGGASAEILRMFPTARSELTPRPSPIDANAAAQAERARRDRRLAEVVRGLKPRGLVSEESARRHGRLVPRVGDGYVVYKKEEELTGYAKEFYERVAEAGALSVGTLVRAVVKVERKIFRARKRVEAGREEGMEGEIDDGEMDVDEQRAEQG